jgi:hypothetical protein
MPLPYTLCFSPVGIVDKLFPSIPPYWETQFTLVDRRRGKVCNASIEGITRRHAEADEANHDFITSLRGLMASFQHTYLHMCNGCRLLSLCAGVSARTSSPICSRSHAATVQTLLVMRRDAFLAIDLESSTALLQPPSDIAWCIEPGSDA